MNGAVHSKNSSRNEDERQNWGSKMEEKVYLMFSNRIKVSNDTLAISIDPNIFSRRLVDRL